MKHRYFILTITSIAAALALASCTKEQEASAPAPQQLHARIEGSGADTRVEFDTSNGKCAWTAGDMIDIHTSAGAYRTAELDASGGFSLPLSSGEARDGYAVYPSGIVGTGTPLTLELPDSYTLDENNTMLDKAPLIAVNDPASDDLWFYHAAGTIYLTLNEVPANTASIAVTFDKRVTGVFDVQTPASGHPFIETDGAATGKTISFTLGTPLAAATDGLLVKIPVPVGTYVGLSIEAKDGSAATLKTYTSTRKRAMYRARGRQVSFPEPVGYTYTFTITNPSPLEHVAGTSTSASIISYRTKNEITQTVPWRVSGYFQDADCTIPYDGTDAGNKPAWLTTFNNASESGSGSESGETVTIVYDDQPVAPSYETNDAATIVNTSIAQRGIVGGPGDYKNLANPMNVVSLDYIKESANCYIVNSAGYYRLPLVMGNGVFNNAVCSNAEKYSGHLSTESDDHRKIFVDYKNQRVENPYLHKSNSVSGYQPGTPTSACVLWEDVDGLIEVQDNFDYNLPSSAISSTGSGDNLVYWLNFHVAKAEQGNAVIAVTDETGTIMWSWHIWVTDYIPCNYPGFDSSDYPDITVTAHNSDTYNVMPFHLGWVIQSGQTTAVTYSEETVFVQIEQSDGEIATLSLTRPTGLISYSLLITEGRCPYYQWGRKDPLWPSNGVDNSKPTWFGRCPTVTLETTLENRTLAYSISHPANLYTEDGKASGLSLTDIRANPWGCDFISLNDSNLYIPVNKTIFDPSPAGYSVSSANSFRGFTATGYSTRDYSQFNVMDLNGDGTIDDEDFQKGWVFYSNDAKDQTIFIPASGSLSYVTLGTDFTNNSHIGVGHNIEVYHATPFMDGGYFLDSFIGGSYTSTTINPIDCDIIGMGVSALAVHPVQNSL